MFLDLLSQCFNSFPYRCIHGVERESFIFRKNILVFTFYIIKRASCFLNSTHFFFLFYYFSALERKKVKREN